MSASVSVSQVQSSMRALWTTHNHNVTLSRRQPKRAAAGNLSTLRRCWLLDNVASPSSRYARRPPPHTPTPALWVRFTCGCYLW